MGKKKCAAIVLAAGQGKRMRAGVPKQYLPLNGKPVLYYSLKAFQESFVDEIILVTAEEEMEYCRTEIVERYGLNGKVSITAGGKERYHSVCHGIMAVNGCDYLFIHDGARPFLTLEILERAYRCVMEYDACVVGMQVKDTIRIAGEDKIAVSTPDRSCVWMMQTPQVFSFPLIKEAYRLLMKEEKSILERGIRITDDAMAVELMTGERVKLVEGSYENIKITTPEDLVTAEAFFRNREQ